MLPALGNRLPNTVCRVWSSRVCGESSFPLSPPPSRPVSAYRFLFFLPGFHRFLFYLASSLSLRLALYYGSLSNMSSDTCPLLSASLDFHPLCLPAFPFFSPPHLSSSLYPGLSALFLPLCSQFLPLCDIARTIRTCTRAHTHTHSYKQAFPWMRLAGLFERRS